MALDNMEVITGKYWLAKKRFFERNNAFKKFKYIEEERKEEIRNNALAWLEKREYTNNMRLALCLFSNLNDIKRNPQSNNTFIGNKYFDFTSNDEEILFYMFVMDPELKLLQISFEEDETEIIKKRYREEFGIDLDTRLLKIEQLYYLRFPSEEKSDDKKLELKK